MVNNDTKLLNMPNFSIGSSFTRKKRHGGSCILVRNGHRYRTLTEISGHSNTNIIEVSAIELTDHSLIIVCIYRPPKTNNEDLDTFFNSLNDILSKLCYGKILIMSYLTNREQATIITKKSPRSKSERCLFLSILSSVLRSSKPSFFYLTCSRFESLKDPSMLVFGDNGVFTQPLFPRDLTYHRHIVRDKVKNLFLRTHNYDGRLQYLPIKE
ncbi:hypothetical protein ACJJTC_006851 [Scirpophaga incertulas]